MLLLAFDEMAVWAGLPSARRNGDDKMDVTFVEFDPKIHKDLIIEYHCRTNYHTITFPPGDRPTYEAYSAKWKPLEQELFYSHIENGLCNHTVFLRMIVSSDGHPIGYFYADLASLPDWGTLKADIGDIYVEANYRRQGIGKRSFAYLEGQLVAMGVNLIRSGTGSHNLQSIGLHQKSGYTECRIEFEKWIPQDAAPAGTV